MTPRAVPIPIVGTKLYAPRSPAGLVARSRLVDRLRAGATGKLTLVSAPAGSGKTTLLAEWLAQRSARDPAVGWVSLDAADNEPATFWTCVIRAFQSVEPGVGERVLDELDGEGSPSVPSLTALLNDLAGLDREIVLVLDDYHVIESPAVHTAVAFVLDHLPPQLHVVVSSRVDPVFPLPRMRARGEIVELRAADLRFTRDEATTFFNGSMSLDLGASDVAELEQRTEGWIAGLKLAALSVRNHPDAHGFIRSFSGDNRYVADYLIEEVLHAQSLRTRTFLLATSILDRLNAPLCDAVVGEGGSQGLLEELERSNLFLVALDERREWYRYHHLFAEVLQAHSRDRNVERLREWHRRASDWYDRIGATEDAVHHADRAGDVERVAELLGRHWPTKDRSRASRQWLDRVKALPERVVRDRPMLHMGYAWGLLNAGELEAAGNELDAIDATHGDARFPSLAREHATARVYLAQSRGDIAGTTTHARRLLELVPPGDHASHATASALVAIAHWADGDLATAYETFTAALQSMRLAGADLDALRGLFVLGDIRAAQGRLRDAAHLYESGLAAALPHPEAETDELHLGLSEVHCERGELAEASRRLAEVEQTMQRGAHMRNRHRWCIGRSRIAAARGDFTRALELLAEAESSHRRDPLPVTRPIAAMKARIGLVQGDVAGADRWLKESGVRVDDEPSFMREYEHVTLARLLIATNRTAEAASLLDRLTLAAKAGGRTGSVVETLALRALIEHAGRNVVGALDTIAEALVLAEPHGQVRVFVDEGARMRDLLRQATARGIGSAYTRHVLAGFDEPAGVAPTGADAPGAAELLTSRELEILRLIAAGMRNREIAAQLFISPATVKRHIANLYNKLGAAHRTEALNRASLLNLI